MSLVTETFFFQSPPRNAGVFKKGRWSGVVFRSCGGGSGWGSGFDPGAELPDEGAEFPGDGDLDLVVVHPAFGECFEAGVEP